MTNRDNVVEGLRNNKSSVCCLKPFYMIHPYGSEEYFEILRDCARKYNINCGNISKVLKGKINHTRGYKFRYA